MTIEKLPFDERNKRGFIAAIKAGDDAGVQGYLGGKIYDLDFADGDGNTPLHHCQHSRILHSILTCQPDPFQINNDKVTAVERMVDGGNVGCAKTLLSYMQGRHPAVLNSLRPWIENAAWNVRNRYKDTVFRVEGFFATFDKTFGKLEMRPFRPIPLGQYGYEGAYPTDAPQPNF